MLKSSFNFTWNLTKKAIDLVKSFAFNTESKPESTVVHQETDEKQHINETIDQVDNNSEKKVKKEIKKRISRKKYRIDDRNRQILEEWYNENKGKGFEVRKVKFELSRKTNLPIPQITHWLRNQRKKSKYNKKSLNRISIKQKILLKDFFDNISSKPDYDQMSTLVKLTDLPEKKVAAWFTKERFKIKLKVQSELGMELTNVTKDENGKENDIIILTD